MSKSFKYFSLILLSLLFACEEKVQTPLFSNSFKELLNEYQEVSLRIGNQGKIDVNFLTKGDSTAMAFLKKEIGDLNHEDSIYKSFLAKLSEPELKDTTDEPANRIIRLVFLDFDRDANPEFYSHCLTLNYDSSTCIRKKFRLEIPVGKEKEFKIKEIPIEITSIDTTKINESQFREIENVLEINDYWLLDRRGTFGDCSHNTWYIETLLDPEYSDLPTYKRLKGTMRGSMVEVVKYLLGINRNEF